MQIISNPYVSSFARHPLPIEQSLAHSATSAYENCPSRNVFYLRSLPLVRPSTKIDAQAFVLNVIDVASMPNGSDVAEDETNHRRRIEN